MRKRVIAGVFLVAYSALLIKFVVFKEIPDIRIGHMMFRFAGTYHTGEGNLVPFKTIGRYLTGHRGRVIALANLAGNIVPFLPVGFLTPMVFPGMRCRAALLLAVGTGLAMEGMEVLFRVGIFDIDDVMLNAVGVAMGYWAFTKLVGKIRG